MSDFFFKCACIVVGIVFIAIGIIIKWKVGEAEFYRRNQFGLQGFKSYKEAVGIRTLDVFLKIISAILILLGAILLLFGIAS